jgi:HSP20 family protein
MSKAEQEVEVKKGEVAKPSAARSLSPFEEMNRMFEGVFPRGWMQPFRWEWPAWSRIPEPFEGRTPKVDIVERDDDILVRAELPGVDKKDVDISTTENTVTIKGSTRTEEKEEKGDYYRCEIASGSFSRTVTLPGNVDSTKAKASFKDGVLELTLPKVEKSKRQKIEIS